MMKQYLFQSVNGQPLWLRSPRNGKWDSLRRLFRAALILLCLMVALPSSGQRTFSHPGAILGQGDLNRVKAHVEAGDEPWASLWTDFQNMDGGLSLSTYTAAPNTDFNTRQRASRDFLAAFNNAIEWHVTGDTKYADCAAKILSDWGNKLETCSVELFQYPAEACIVAAEMLRDSTGAFYSGWAESDRETFLQKVRNIMVPACQSFCEGISHPSWYTPAASAVLCAGVLLDDSTLYNQGLELMTRDSYWGPMFGGTFEEDGQVREMGRDNVHGGLSMADICIACLTAYNQGDDLFAAGDNLLLKGMNYWCRYNTGHKDTPYTPLPSLEGSDSYTYYFISLHNNGFRLRPDAACFEAVYHHYREVKGIDVDSVAPYLGYAVKLARPERNAYLLGYGTLFFTVDSAASPYMTKTPARLLNPKAEAGYRSVELTWDHPTGEDVRGFKIFRSTTPYVKTTGTPYYTWDYYTNNVFTDTDVTPGTTYYYKVVGTNLAGDGKASSTVHATPVDTVSQWADGWNFADLDSTQSTAGYAAQDGDTTLVLWSRGTDIGGTADRHGFVYKKVTGDVTITARLASVNEDFFKEGLIIRGSLEPNATRLAMVKGEKGYRLLRVTKRRKAGLNSSWFNGSNYIYAPVWMRLTRQGNYVTCYVSRDSTEGSWVQVSIDQIALPDTVYVGVGSCSGSDDQVTETVFDHVSVQGQVVADAIKAVTTEKTQNSGATEYYDLTGRRLAGAPEQGIYIEKSGNRVVKRCR